MKTENHPLQTAGLRQGRIAVGVALLALAQLVHGGEQGSTVIVREMRCETRSALVQSVGGSDEKAEGTRPALELLQLADQSGQGGKQGLGLAAEQGGAAVGRRVGTLDAVAVAPEELVQEHAKSEQTEVVEDGCELHWRLLFDAGLVIAGLLVSRLLRS
jgi:hypothetical protein